MIRDTKDRTSAVDCDIVRSNSPGQAGRNTKASVFIIFEEKVVKAYILFIIQPGNSYAGSAVNYKRIPYCRCIVLYKFFFGNK